MAVLVPEIAVRFLFTNLSELIARESDLLVGIKDKVEWIDSEFRVMVAHLGSLDALHQLHPNAAACMEETRAVIRRADYVIQTYAKRAAEAEMDAIYKRPSYWVQRRKLAKDIEGIKNQIVHVRNKWCRVDFNEGDIDSAAIKKCVSAAMGKLDAAMNGEYHCRVPSELLRDIQWLRDELEPLDHFLQQIDGLLLPGERHGVWIQELRNIFQLVDEACTNYFVEEYSFLQSIYFKREFNGSIYEIKNKILQLYKRYHLYGFNEIQGGSNSILPKIRMSDTPPDHESVVMKLVGTDSIYWFSVSSVIQFLFKKIFSIVFDPKQDFHKNVSSFKGDFTFMKALLEDTRLTRGDLDRRVKVWLEQMKKIYEDLEAVIDASTMNHGMFRLIFGRRKMVRKFNRIGCEIRYMTARKMTYGISRAMGESSRISLNINNTTNDPADHMFNILNSTISKHVFRREVESVGFELKLIQAFLEDVNTTEKVDATLKFWVEEMKGLGREAMAILERRSTSIYGRFQTMKRINQFKTHLVVVSKWNHSYQIDDARSRKISSNVNHGFEEMGPYPSGAIEQQCELLSREIKLMKAMESDIKEMDEVNGTTDAWLEEMRKIAIDAQNLISIHEGDVTTLKRFVETYAKILTIWCTTEANRLTYRSPFARDFDQIKDKITSLHERRIAYGIGYRKNLPPHIVSEIKEKLLARHEHPCVIPIIGTKRAQKIALRELTYGNSIRLHFDCCAWVYVHEELSGASILRDVVKQIAECCLDEEPKREILEASATSRNEEELMQILAHKLMNKKFLVVLDEVQTIEAWRCLVPAFENISTGSKIILLTHERINLLLHEASEASSSSSQTRYYQVGYKKFRLMEPVELVKIRQENRISSHLTQCLFYFLLFPVNFEIPSRRLIALWVAEGLVRQRNDNEPVEHVAERNLIDLVDLKLVTATKKNLNGKVKSCMLSDGIRESWSTKAKEARFFTEPITRLVDQHGGSNDSFCIQIHGNPNSSTNSLSNYKDVVSFLSFDSREGNKPGEDIGKFLEKCISTRRCFLELIVLDLERVFRPKLTEALRILTRLKYLGLRWTYLENLPEYISKLLNLQVLDLKHTYISTLPASIWRMLYLRHLYLSETFRTRFTGRPSKISLNDLQTLLGAFIDEDTPVSNGLDTALNIRKLGLSCRSSSSQSSNIDDQLKAVDQWISNLQFLESLSLKSRDVRGNAYDLHLNPLVNHQKLSDIYLLGKLLQSVVSRFPLSLTDITLSGSELGEDPMESLGQLPNLLILKLLARSVVTDKIRCSSGSFSQLKVLRIWNLEVLEEWEVEEGALPSLEDLEIRSCENLKMLPDGLKEINELKKLKLTRMPQGFIDEINDQNPALWMKIEGILEVE